MEFWIVREHSNNEVFIRPFNCLQMARNYANNECVGFVRIERHVMNFGYQGTEELEAAQ
jgi:hypothetical protein